MNTAASRLKDNEQIEQRKAKLSELRVTGQAYPNGFRRNALAGDLLKTFKTQGNDTLVQLNKTVALAGRMMRRRVMGKVMFLHLQDMSGQIQLFIASNHLAKGEYAEVSSWDIGDIMGACGELFRTQTGELSVRVRKLRLLTKSLRPLPDKYHGLSDVEMRYRQRYLDLMMHEQSRQIFRVRSKIISTIRHFLEQHGFVEVETPMMHQLPGGASAKPFITHHNALNRDLFLRIAPELYLKRLVIGGMEQVFEINRNFRNEGVSTRHNPEFTMLEFYLAYATYEDLMHLTETMLRTLAEEIYQTHQITYQGTLVDLSKPFLRLPLKEAITYYQPDIKPEQLEHLDSAQSLAKRYNISVHPHWGLGKIQLELFEKLVESQLQQPTFITEFPAEVSPLSRANEQNPFVTDRFELYIGGYELANGFSELNDPEDQAHRFERQLQAKASGDDEAMSFDHDYIQALEYGLPPTAGEGIGIDRLVMFFTNAASIREVILFPQMR